MDIIESVDRLFQGDEATQREDRRNFLNQLHVNYSRALASRNRLMIGIGVVWFIGYAISGGLITEGEIISFKVENLDRTLIFIGPIIGVMSYVLMSTINLMHLLKSAILRSYKHLLPVAYELDLDLLTVDFDFAHVETIFEDQAQKLNTALSNVVKVLLTLSSALVPLIAILQIGAAMAMRDTPHAALGAAASTLFGALFWLRGMSLVITDFKRDPPSERWSPTARAKSA